MSLRVGSFARGPGRAPAFAAKPQIQWNNSYDFSTIKTFQWQDAVGRLAEGIQPVSPRPHRQRNPIPADHERADRGHRESRRVRQLHRVGAAGRAIGIRHQRLHLRRAMATAGPDTAMGSAPRSAPCRPRPPLASSKSSAAHSSSTSGRRARSSFGAAPRRTSACPTIWTRLVATPKRPSRRWRNKRNASERASKPAARGA